MSKKEPAIKTNEDYKLLILDSFEKKQEEKESKPQRLSEFDNKWNMNNKIISLFETNIEKDQKLRFVYAIILVSILGIELLALITIFILVGCEVLKYSDIAFNLFITGGIAEVFVLVRVIVKYLFKDNLTNALNIILENNNKSRYKNNKKKNKITDKRWEINVFCMQKNYLKSFKKKCWQHVPSVILYNRTEEVRKYD